MYPRTGSVHGFAICMRLNRLTVKSEEVALYSDEPYNYSFLPLFRIWPHIVFTDLTVVPCVHLRTGADVASRNVMAGAPILARFWFAKCHLILTLATCEFLWA